MKMSFLRIFLAIFSLAIFNVTHAQSSNDLANLLNSVHTMRADFTQTVYDNRGKAVQRSSGRMAMERPGKFRWEVKKPLPQLIIANQSRLWIYDPDLEQVTIRSLQNATADSPALLLSNVDPVLEKEYVVKPEAKNKPGIVWFALSPRSPDNMFASIQMGFVNNKIHEMRLQDHLGHTTLIQFSNAKMNAPIAASSFVFKAPANVDVIDETHKKSR